MKERATAFGRDPDPIKIMSGIYVVVGKTREKARAKFDELQALIKPEVWLALNEAIKKRP